MEARPAVECKHMIIRAAMGMRRHRVVRGVMVSIREMGMVRRRRVHHLCRDGVRRHLSSSSSSSSSGFGTYVFPVEFPCVV